MSDLIEALEIMKEHQRLDRFAQGVWLQGEKIEGKFKGCFYGCAMQSEEKPIEAFCEKYGMSLWIGYWSERVFEGLPKNEAKTWPVQLLESLVNFKGDLEIVKHKLAIKRLSSLISDGFPAYVNNAIKVVIECHEKFLSGDKDIDLKSAESAAWSARAARAAAWEKERDWMLEILK
jgi:hypothetical protein